MVLTRSMCKAYASIDGGSDATPNAGNSRHGTNTVVHEDAARVAVDHHASARSRRTKSNSALQPNISREDKPARTNSRATVPKSDKGERPIGRKSSLVTRPRRGYQATKQGRGSKTNASLDAPESEAAPRANARRVRRKVDGPVDRAKQCNAIIPEASPANNDAGSSCQMPRRSARLASKSRNAVLRGQCSPTNNVTRVVGWCAQTRRKRTRTQEGCEDASEPSSSRRTRRQACEVAGQSNVRIEGRTSGSDTKTESSEGSPVGSRTNADRPERVEEGSTSVPSIENEDVDQDWPLVIAYERHTSVDSATSAYMKKRESTEPRSSSVESLLTTPPTCMEEEEQALLHHDFDAMITLDSIPDNDERDAMNQAYLRQLQDRRPNDEADIEAEIAANRYRSLAPEPDQGLVDAIRSGRISGLGSPERPMREK
ncbi:hypothetical protein ACEPAI_1498 [Sanghuangporus weigelae]